MKSRRGPAAARLPDLAVGSEEAAGIMGLHWSRPGKLACEGVISSREISSNDDGTRVFRVYSLEECEENYADYLRLLAGEADLGVLRRRRTREDDREVVRRLLAAVPEVLFLDAIGAREAAEILGCWPTYVPRLINAGRLVGRIAWSQRKSKSVVWIISRTSAEKLAVEMTREERLGQKVGRPRSGKIV